MTEDKRPDPKPRKYPHLWQAYLSWWELMEMRKKANQRISSIEKGKSNLDAQFERDYMEHMGMDGLLEYTKKTMVNYGKAVGPIWDWLTSIKGLGAGSLAAQLIAQVDDIARYDTVAKLWRVAGFGIYPYWVDEDGKVMAPRDGWHWRTVKGQKEKEKVWKETKPKDGWMLKSVADRNMEGWHSPFNRKLKGVCWNIQDSFIKQQTPHYVDIYYAQKEYQRVQHPEPVSMNGKKMYSDGHIHNRAWRKMIKRFLRDMWLHWRELEGLPVTEPFEERELVEA